MVSKRTNLKHKKIKLETDIHNLIAEFQNDTGLSVVSLNFRRVIDVTGEKRRDTHEVFIEVKLI